MSHISVISDTYIPSFFLINCKAILLFLSNLPQHRSHCRPNLSPPSQLRGVWRRRHRQHQHKQQNTEVGKNKNTNTSSWTQTQTTNTKVVLNGSTLALTRMFNWLYLRSLPWNSLSSRLSSATLPSKRKLQKVRTISDPENEGRGMTSSLSGGGIAPNWAKSRTGVYRWSWLRFYIKHQCLPHDHGSVFTETSSTWNKDVDHPRHPDQCWQSRPGESWQRHS